MSKSKKNVVDPNDIINIWADTARWFMLQTALLKEIFSGQKLVLFHQINLF